MARATPIRESVTTINDDGSRNFLRPADVSGRFTWGRRAVAFGLLLIYALLPWIKINGYPAVFLDVVNRRFHLFGLTFAAQDLWMAFFFITGLGFTLFLLTALFGRLWCGWACPQTVFMEHVFRRIERLFEGDHLSQRKLDKMSWGKPEKWLRRGLKQVVFIGIAMVIAHIFLSYFISMPQLYQYITHSPSEHMGAFVFILAATGILYFNFAWFREQLCLIICPYGRLQSALQDDDTLVIGYDEQRGEPRGPAKKEGVGDCVNCHRCVQVCPTGIDIRQGLQIECIGCANCVDACDEMMAKLGRPQGLVRYDSFNGLTGGKRRILRPRLALYGVLLLIGAAVMTGAASSLKPANLGVTRMTGAPYVIEPAQIRNQYMVRLVNKSTGPLTFKVSANAAGQAFALAGFQEPVTLESMAEEQRPLVAVVSIDDYRGPFTLTVTAQDDAGEFLLEQEVEFLGPDADRLRAKLARDAEKQAP